MGFDRLWGMPGEDWQQQGSFLAGATPPALGPASGSLVQLPCVNWDWVRLMCGALDQLRNPSTWPGLTDAQMAAVLSNVDQLIEMIGTSVETACVNPIVNVTFANCSFTLHFADGSSAPVLNWDAELDGCIKAHVPPQVPTPLQPGFPNQNACAIAEWLRQQLAVVNNQRLHDALQAGQTVDQWVKEAIQALVAIAPVLEVIVGPFEAQYQTVLPQPLTDLQASITDAAFQDHVKCAIYNAIKAVGYVNASNFAQVATNLNAIVYVHAWVPPMMANLWNNLGLQAIQALQQVGSLTSADCTDCGQWCHEFDFTVSNQGFAPYLTPGGVYLPGQGWGQTACSPPGSDACINIQSPVGAVVTATDAFIGAISSQPNLAGDFLIGFKRAGALVGTASTNLIPDGALHKYHIAGPGSVTYDQIFIAMETSGLPQSGLVVYCQLMGNGPNPYGPDNCTH